jgi:hypothetical protein
LLRQRSKLEGGRIYKMKNEYIKLEV